LNTLLEDRLISESEGKKLSKEKLKELIGDDSISDEVAVEMIDSLYQLSVIAYYLTK
jgi:hypothetical protein